MFRTFYTALILLSLGLVACTPQQQDKAAEEKAATLVTDEDKLSYGLGMNIGASVLQQDVPDMNLDALIAGIKDTVNEREPQVSMEELQAVIGRIQVRQAEEAAALAAENAKQGEVFLTENGKKKGITTTGSGLQYQVLASGEGESPVVESKVKTHYHGTLIDGSVFDSSVDRGEPVEFGVNQVIPGWTEVLQLMKEGDKWRVFIPSELAYGEISPGPGIPPNSTLIFDIELLEVIN